MRHNTQFLSCACAFARDAVSSEPHWHAEALALHLATQVNTLNVEGKKKRGKFGFFRRPDYKKAFVVLNEKQAGGSARPQ